MRIAILLLIAGTLTAAGRIGPIDFFGGKGIDAQAVLRALPFHEGDQMTKNRKQEARETVRRITGQDATEVALVCCDEKGDEYMFIGLPGKSTRKFAANAAPTGTIRLAPELLDLQKRIDAAEVAATQKGGDAATEDDSTGYALSRDPETRKMQLQLRDYALKHEDDLLRVLADSSDSDHRSHAAVALGYAQQSPRQIAALVRASRDANKDVRNDATRALGVLLVSNAALVSQVPPDNFIELAWSGIWSDRNKGCFVLEPMSRARDPKLLARLRDEALDPLIDMARWRSSGHAACGKMVLARVAGAGEEDIVALGFGPVSAVLDLLKRTQ